MPVTEARWDITRCWFFYPGGWHDEYSVRMDGSDTTINGMVYKKLSLVTHHAPGTPFDSIYVNFLGGMRESNKQVFFVSEYLCLDLTERMLYDFNETNPGDTIFTQVLTNDLTQFIPHIVYSVDSVLVGGAYHRRITLTDVNSFFIESWIEGVGSTLGLIYPTYWLLTDNSYDLNCFYHNNEQQFSNEEPSLLFCSAPFPEIGCDETSATPPDMNIDSGFQIFPNPSTDVLNVNSTIPFQNANIINALGKRILSWRKTDQIDVSSLPPGIYFLQFTGYSGQNLSTLKWVKN